MAVLVGTASWSAKGLVDSGRFYPPGISTAEARLRYYASRFPIVEVDSSYYAMPTPATSQLWGERTPHAFVMNVKAFRLFTGHQTSPKVMHKDIREALPARLVSSPRASVFYRDLPTEIVDELWRRFIEALLPLRAAGKLGLVHFQFPPWITCNSAGVKHVRHCVERMAGHTLSVEFRHASWFDGANAASTLAFERELDVVHTVVDGPQGFSNSVPALWEVTRPSHALLRLHGRNVDTWNIEGAVDSSERFNYDYSEGELSDLAVKVTSLAHWAESTHVIFNNNMEDQGQRNATSMSRLLEP